MRWLPHYRRLPKTDQNRKLSQEEALRVSPRDHNVLDMAGEAARVILA